ncbi:MAG: hypothetical protein UU88_C0001G0076 [Parcubacteria group bacterium GW2011_GWC1_42_11]|uniref:Uncharacterized protein n=1 Tax=Candidatus Nomurabacteria bacterium GW2011_GWC2_42_20 TaxID=1618756 RepID=A0A0G0ZG27_9BACT|nr:MAG: hypothetical protein UU88_C0001G0076 [Parcubacteria group bacterium GW2011_GWC1_42_11]KKS47619.1 MAG: hypothetical protein UV12_C0006G0043 [Candidatus Nomurabacteria bacterium GW2011_GWC2_42_20]TAN36852.1 MAG: hypothetical protein EPN27_00425 [Patescibacteria group bacterium]HBH71471.1 hypothetical protein [Candidatus Yonathbacteria bacterium]
MNNAIVIVALVLAFVAWFSLLCITFKSRNAAEEKHAPTNVAETYTESLQKTRELERATKEFFDVYRKITKSGKDPSKEEVKPRLSEWELFSLQEVLNSKTFEQLAWASKLTLEGSLAAKFVPIQQEQISTLEVEIAGSNVEELIRVARMAPKGGQAEMLAFSKLQRLLSNKQ